MFGSPLSVLPLRLYEERLSKCVLCCCCYCCSRYFIVGKIIFFFHTKKNHPGKAAWGVCEERETGLLGLWYWWDWIDFVNLKLLISCLLEGKAWTLGTEEEVSEEEEVTRAVIVTQPVYFS